MNEDADKIAILSAICQLLQEHGYADQEVSIPPKRVSFDNDHKDGALFLTVVRDGEEREYLLRSMDIVPTAG